VPSKGYLSGVIVFGSDVNFMIYCHVLFTRRVKVAKYTWREIFVTAWYERLFIVQFRKCVKRVVFK